MQMKMGTVLRQGNCFGVAPKEVIKSKAKFLSKASEASLGGRKNGRSAYRNELGGFGGVSPHYRAYLAPCAPRGGVWGGPSPPL